MSLLSELTFIPYFLRLWILQMIKIKKTENTSEHSQVMGFLLKQLWLKKTLFQTILFILIKHSNVNFILRVNNFTPLQGKETTIYSVNHFKQHKLFLSAFRSKSRANIPAILWFTFMAFFSVTMFFLCCILRWFAWLI